MAKRTGLHNVSPPPRADRRRRYNARRAARLVALLAATAGGWAGERTRYPTRASAAGQAKRACEALGRFEGIDRSQIEQRTWEEHNDGDGARWRWAIRLKGEGAG